jgi:hypothetical protein
MYQKEARSLQLPAMSHVLQRFCSLAALSAVLLLASSSFAQIDRSGLSGTVVDASGHLLPQAHVTVVENATGLRRDSISDARGNYSIPGLPVGTYTVTFEHQGFKKLEYLDVEQVIGRTRSLDARLQVTGGEERVEVTSASCLTGPPTVNLFSRFA